MYAGQQRGQDRGVAQTIGEAWRRRALRQDGSNPCYQQSQHVGQVVSGVGKQRGGIRHKAVSRLDQHESRVQRDADREGAAEIRRRMAVTGMILRAVIVSVMRMIVMCVIVVMMVTAHATRRSTLRQRRRQSSI